MVKEIYNFLRVLKNRVLNRLAIKLATRGNGKLFLGDAVVVSSKAIIYLDGSFLKIGNDCIIHDFSYIRLYGGHVEIGNNVSINPFTVIYGHGGVKIGNNTRIASHVTIIPANHKFGEINIPIYKQGEVMKGINIGDDVWIATGVKVLDGVNIGKGCVIGAGTILTRSVPDYSVVVGNPGRIIKIRK